MAVVYAAEDTRHGRQVAIKVLRSELGAVLGAERFLQEVKVTAVLQHPHILSLFDSGAADGLLYYVMPRVEGESVRQRLSREGPFPVDEAIRLIRSTAEALAYAHRRGVVHRDLKPENILLHEHQPLVADFGVALAIHAAGRERLTSTGLSIGTPQYMSPEQATGGPVDARSDVFSLACVAYEMLTGEQAHPGSTPQAALTAVVTHEPRPVRELRHATPENVAAAVHVALEKLPADRFSGAQEFADALGDPAWRPSGAHLTLRRPASGRWAALAAVASLILGLGIGALAFNRGDPPAAEPVRRWNLLLPDSAPLALTGPAPIQAWPTALAVARDGSTLAYVASVAGGRTRLYVRRLDGDSTVALPGTDGAFGPFFSPDGQWIGFVANGTLQKVSVTGGSPVALARVARPSGTVWTSDDRILLLEEEGFLMQWVPAGGGPASAPIRLATQFQAPDLLPGEQWAVGHLSSGQVALLSLEDGSMFAVTRRGVVPLDSTAATDLLRGTSPRYVPTGHLVFAVGNGVLTAMPFDGATRRVLGPPVPVIDSIRVEEGVGFAEFTLAANGTLLYAVGGNQNAGYLAWLDRNGRLDTLPFPRAALSQLRLSPDASRIAVQVLRPSDDGWDVWVYDLRSGQRRRVPVDPQYRAYPILWSADGTEIMMGLWDPVQFLNRGAQFYSLTGTPGVRISAEDISWMAAHPNGREFSYSIWSTGELKVRAFASDTASYTLPVRGYESSFSPDGRWLAFRDVERGISVSPAPPDGRVFPVAERGTLPSWDPAGRRLFFRDGRRFYEVDVSTERGFQTGPPRLIGEGPFARAFAWNYTVGPDGRLAVIVAASDLQQGALNVVTGFHELLRRTAPH